MKKNLLTLITVLFCAITFAQIAQSVPQGINYQAVARDASGDVLINQTLTIQFSVISDISTGNISWQETHTATTNDYGLFTAIIGQGTTTGSGSSATFDAVDWGSSNHLLKVEVNDGNGYVDMGTSAFMNVPYSLYAKTSSDAPAVALNTAKVGYTDALVWNGTAVAWIISVMEDEATSARAAEQSNTAAIAAEVVMARAAELVNANAIAALEARIVALEPIMASVGDLRAGGIVFWVDPSDNSKGLVCALEDQRPIHGQDSRIQWGDRYVGATGSSGVINTTKIIEMQGEPATSYAAGLARAYAGGDYTDWFLPSKEELNQMDQNKATLEAVTGFTAFVRSDDGKYWSSSESEYNASNSWMQDFDRGYQYNTQKSTPLYVRAVRAF
ncbi:Lcl C-terminal domain-containing protein [Polaribacter glomeratus]|uniref:Lcl C-terminal domain-containing protein n=1 Tax=Polaribacter glomeratus TaxID=102 RepID=A0A2S7WG63_9FLAO|nr:DUF1566 domain-containing protein [Polaribacter glomeratus]PQJ76291.1 hypothetical protein BTO16_10240 [Polaribacter glomeratus]TXD63714.1 DUF1566 domain-containing protein [Polaribacter glomeratus]